MSIMRAPRAQSNFYILDKTISEDRRLSWSARGLLVFLLGKPDHWEVSIKALVNETAGCIRKAGGHSKRDAVKVLVVELMEAGYVTRSDKPKHGESGFFDGYDYIVSETASAVDDPHRGTDYPAPAEPAPAEPEPANPHQVSTDVLVSTEKAASTNRRAPRFDAKAHLESLGVDPKIIRDWIALRKSKRAPVTETAIDGISKEAGKARLSLQSALKICCERGWQGFNADWLKGSPGRAQHWSEKNDEFIAQLTGRNRNEPDQDYIDV